MRKSRPTHCIAYKNGLTVKLSPQSNGWVRGSQFMSLHNARGEAITRAVELPNSVIAVFPLYADGRAWWEGQPALILNSLPLQLMEVSQ